MSETKTIDLRQPIYKYHPVLKRFIKRTDEVTGQTLELFHIIHRSLIRPQLRLVKNPHPTLKGETIEQLDIDPSVETLVVEQRALLAQKIHISYITNKLIELTEEEIDDIKELMARRYLDDMIGMGQVISAFDSDNTIHVLYTEQSELPENKLNFDEAEFLNVLADASAKENISEKEILLQYVRALYMIEPEHRLLADFGAVNDNNPV